MPKANLSLIGAQGFWPKTPCLQRRFGEFCATRAARRRLDSFSRHPGAESRYRHRDNRATYFSKRTGMYASPSAHGWISARITSISFGRRKRNGQIGFKRQQERSLQSDAFNMQQEVAIKGISRSTFCVNMLFEVIAYCLFSTDIRVCLDIITPIKLSHTTLR